VFSEADIITAAGYYVNDAVPDISRLLGMNIIVIFDLLIKRVVVGCMLHPTADPAEISEK